MTVGVHEAVGEAFVRCARRPDDDRAGEARPPTGYRALPGAAAEGHGGLAGVASRPSPEAAVITTTLTNERGLRRTDGLRCRP